MQKEKKKILKLTVKKKNYCSVNLTYNQLNELLQLYYIFIDKYYISNDASLNIFNNYMNEADQVVDSIIM